MLAEKRFLFGVFDKAGVKFEARMEGNCYPLKKIGAINPLFLEFVE